VELEGGEAHGAIRDLLGGVKLTPRVHEVRSGPSLGLLRHSPPERRHTHAHTYTHTYTHTHAVPRRWPGLPSPRHFSPLSPRSEGHRSSSGPRWHWHYSSSWSMAFWRDVTVPSLTSSPSHDWLLSPHAARRLHTSSKST